jgi:hypothetical protein
MHTDEEEAIYAERWEKYFPSRRAPAHVRAVTAAATPTPPTATAVDLDTGRPRITFGRPGCVSPPKELDIRPAERLVFGPPPPPTPTSTDPERAAAMASRRPRATAQTAGAAAPAPALPPPDPGTDPGQAPGTRAKPRYFTAKAPAPRAKGTQDLGFIFPERNHSQSWYDVRSTSKQRPAIMRVERINVVSERDETVSERGTEGVGVTLPALYLHW